MMNSEPKRLCGRYLAENKDDFLKAYHIVVDVKETDKSYIMQLVEFNSRYSAQPYLPPVLQVQAGGTQ